jgi:hypothetical protein
MKVKATFSTGKKVIRTGGKLVKFAWIAQNGVQTATGFTLTKSQATKHSLESMTAISGKDFFTEIVEVTTI